MLSGGIKPTTKIPQNHQTEMMNKDEKNTQALIKIFTKMVGVLVFTLV